MVTQAQAVAPKRNGMTRRMREQLTAYLFMSPYLIVALVFTFGAMLYALVASFTDWKLLNTPQFIGLDQYWNVLRDPHFHKALGNTLLFAVVVVFCQTWLSILMAVALNAKLRALRFFRTAWYAP